MKKKSKDWRLVRLEMDALKGAGFEVTVKNDYHWHVRERGISKFVNVWPTASKYMLDGASGANHYRDVVHSVTALFNEVRNTNAHILGKSVDDLREGGLDYLKNKLI